MISQQKVTARTDDCGQLAFRDFHVDVLEIKHGLLRLLRQGLRRRGFVAFLAMATLLLGPLGVRRRGVPCEVSVDDPHSTFQIRVLYLRLCDQLGIEYAVKTPDSILRIGNGAE